LIPLYELPLLNEILIRTDLDCDEQLELENGSVSLVKLKMNQKLFDEKNALEMKQAISSSKLIDIKYTSWAQFYNQIKPFLIPCGVFHVKIFHIKFQLAIKNATKFGCLIGSFSNISLEIIGDSFIILMRKIFIRFVYFQEKGFLTKKYLLSWKYYLLILT